MNRPSGRNYANFYRMHYIRVSEVEDFTDVAGTVLEKEPDLLLLDLNLPVESGYDICTKSVKVLRCRLSFSPAAQILWMN